MCVIDTDRESAAWIGDSGGPLIVKNGEVVTQIGLVSWGTMNPEIVGFDMYMNLYHFNDWIKDAMERAKEELWLELYEGTVMVQNQMGNLTTICNDNVGKNEINAICREMGYERGSLGSSIYYYRCSYP